MALTPLHTRKTGKESVEYPGWVYSPEYLEIRSSRFTACRDDNDNKKFPEKRHSEQGKNDIESMVPCHLYD